MSARPSPGYARHLTAPACAAGARLLPASGRRSMPSSRCSAAGAASRGHDPDRELFGAVLLAQLQELRRQGNRRQLVHARVDLLAGRQFVFLALRTWFCSDAPVGSSVADDLSGPIRRHPHQAARLARVGLALPRRTLPGRPPRVSAGPVAGREEPAASGGSSAGRADSPPDRPGGRHAGVIRSRAVARSSSPARSRCARRPLDAEFVAPRSAVRSPLARLTRPVSRRFWAWLGRGVCRACVSCVSSRAVGSPFESATGPAPAAIPPWPAIR